MDENKPLTYKEWQDTKKQAEATPEPERKTAEEWKKWDRRANILIVISVIILMIILTILVEVVLSPI